MLKFHQFSYAWKGSTNVLSFCQLFKYLGLFVCLLWFCNRLLLLKKKKLPFLQVNHRLVAGSSFLVFRCVVVCQSGDRVWLHCVCCPAIPVAVFLLLACTAQCQQKTADWRVWETGFWRESFELRRLALLFLSHWECKTAQTWVYSSII